MANTCSCVRRDLVCALHSDLIGPDTENKPRQHECLRQPPSVWYTTGFLVPHVFQQEAGRSSDEQQSFSDLAGEEPSNKASLRLEQQEKEDGANDALDQANTHRSCFPSSLGLRFILEKGATLEASITWGYYSPLSESEDEKSSIRTPQLQTISFPIGWPVSSHGILRENDQQGLHPRWIARSTSSQLGIPSKTTRIRYPNPVTALQFGRKQVVRLGTSGDKTRSEDDNQTRQEHEIHRCYNIGITEYIQADLKP